MILKTHARLFTTNMDESLTLLQSLVGRGPDYRFQMKEAGIEIAGLGDFCVVAGTLQNLQPFRSSHGPLVVDDLEQTKGILLERGAKITKPDAESETGRYFYAVHPDGSEVEYIQWKPELRKRILGF